MIADILKCVARISALEYHNNQGINGSGAVPLGHSSVRHRSSSLAARLLHYIFCSSISLTAMESPQMSNSNGSWRATRVKMDFFMILFDYPKRG